MTELAEALNTLENQKNEVAQVRLRDGIMPMEDLAHTLGAENEDEFIELYNTDIERWKNQCDNLYHSRLTRVTNKLGEQELFHDDESNDNYWSRMSKILDSFVNLMQTNRADYIEMGKQLDKANQMLPKAVALKDKTQLYKKLVDDREAVFLAKQAVDYYYLEVIVAQRDSVLTDNSKLAKNWQKFLSLFEDMKKTVELNVQHESGSEGDKPAKT